MEELPAEVTEAPAPAEEIPAEPEPVYEEPVYEEPIYEEPVYEESVYEEPAYEEPAYEAPAEEVTVNEEPPAPEETNENPAEPEAPAEMIPEPAAESTEVQPEVPAEPEVQPAETEAAPAEKQINEIYSEICVKADRLNSCLKLENVWAGYSKEKNTLAFHLTGDNGRVTFYVPVLFDEEEKAAPWTVTGEDLKKLPEQRIILIQGDAEGSLKGTKNLTPEWVGDLPAILVDLAGHGGDRELRELAVTECTLPQSAEEPAPAAEQPAEEAPAEEAPAAENTPEEKPAEEPIPAGDEETVTAEEQPAEEVPAAETPAEETPEQPEAGLPAELAPETGVEVPAEKPLRFAAEEILLHVGDTLTPEIVNTEGKATLMGLSSETEAVRLEGETLTALSEGETTVFLASADPLEIADMIPVRVVADEVEIPETVTEAEDTAPHFARTEEHLAVGETLTLDVVNPENKTVLVGLSGDTNAVLWDEEARTLTALSDGEVTAILTTVDPLEVTSLAVVRIGGETPEAVSAEAETLLRNNDPSAAPEGFEPEMMAGLRLDREYLALSAGDEIQLHILGIPEDIEPYAQVSWTVENRSGEEDRSTVDVDENGNITAAEQKSGYGIVTTVVTIGEYEFKARCRVDVMPKVSSAVTNASLTSNKATTELYQTAYTKIKIVLEFPQNRTASSEGANTVSESPRMTGPDMGSAIKSAAFADPAAASFFDLRVADDRTLEVIPTADAIANPKSVKSSYKTAINVTGEKWQATTDVLTLTVKKTLPKITAKAIKFNSYIDREAMPLVFSGGTVESVEADPAKTNPDWLDLEGTDLRLTEAAHNAKKSGKYYLLAKADGYAESVMIPVTVSVSAAVTAPKLTFKPSSLTLNPVTGDEAGTTASVSLAQYADEDIEVISVKEGKTEYAPDAAPISCAAAGLTLTCSARDEINSSVAHTFTVTLGIGGNAKAGTVTVKTLKNTVKPSMTVKAAGTINTEVPGSPVTLTVTAKNFVPAGEYSVSFTKLNGKAEEPAEEGAFSTAQDGNVITVTGGEGLTAGTYYAYVSLNVNGDDVTAPKAKVTVKTDPKAVKSAALKLKGNLDPIRPSVPVTVTPTLKNWYGHVPAPADLVFYSGTGKNAVQLDDPDKIPFDVVTDGTAYQIFLKDGAQIDPKTQKFSVGMQDEGETIVTKSPAGLTVKMGVAKLTLDPAKPELLRNDRFDSAAFRITAADGTLSGISRVELLENKTSAPFELVEAGTGVWAIKHAGDQITVPVKTRSAKLTLQVWLEGNATTSPNAKLTATLTLVDTKDTGNVERFGDYRNLTWEVYPENAGEVHFFDNNWQYLEDQEKAREGTIIKVSLYARPGFEQDKVLYREAGNTEYTSIPESMTLTVGESDIHIRAEFKEKAIEEADPKYFTFTSLGDNKCRVSLYNGPYTNALSIPSKGTNGCVVTEIGPMASYGEDGYSCTNNTFYGKVIVPSTVKVIKAKAFGCGGVTDISLPDGLTTIESEAFSWGLTKIHIPDSVTALGSGAFSNCGSLEEINYPLSLTEILPDEYDWISSPFPGKGYGSTVPSFKSIVVPEGVTFLPDNIFESTSIREITLPESLTSIGAYAFSGSTLESIIIPAGVTSVAESAFNDCDELETVLFSKGVESLGNNLLSNCDNLTNVYFPSTINSVGDWFINIENVVSYKTIVHCVRDSFIWNWFIQNNPVLENVLVEWNETDTGIPSAGDKISVSFGVSDTKGNNIRDVAITLTNTLDERDVYYGVTDYDGQWTVLLPQNMTYTAAYSHDDFTVADPAEITTHSEQDITITATAVLNEELNAKYFTFDSLGNNTCRVSHFSELNRRLHLYTDVLSIPSHGPDGCVVTEIGFMNQKIGSTGCSTTIRDFSKVLVPSTVKVLRADAFGCSSNIEEIILPEGLTTIEKNAIYGRVKVLHLPDSITTMSGNAVSYDPDLEVTEINYPMYLQNIPQEYDDAYAGSSPFPSTVRKIEIPYGVTAIPDHAFHGLSTETITLPESLISIGNYVFYANPVKYLRIPDSVSYMDDNALEGSDLELLYCSYGSYAWKWAQRHGYKDILMTWDNIGVSETDLFTFESINASTCRISNYTGEPTDWLTIPSEGPNGCTVTEVGQLRESDQYDGYDPVSYFNTVYVPSSVRIIRQGAFTYGAAKEIRLSEGLTTIENYSFPYTLEKINLPDSITTLGSDIFKWRSDSNWTLDDITVINYPLNLTQLLPYSSDVLYDGSIREYYHSPFGYLSAVKSITVPEGVISLPDYVFSGCYFEEIYLPNSLEKIGIKTFNSTYNHLNKLIVPPNVSEIGELAFGVLDGHQLEFDIYCIRNSYTWNHLGDNYASYIDAHRKEWNGELTLSAPTDFKFDAANVADRGISVSFLPVSGASGYYIYYSKNSTFSSGYSRVEAAESDSGRWSGYIGGLEKGTRYYFWAAAYDKNHNIGPETECVTAITSSLDGVSFTNRDTGSLYTNYKIIGWDANDPFYLAYDGAGGNGTVEVRAYVMDSRPNFNDMDLSYAWEYLYGSGIIGVDTFTADTLSDYDGAIPFSLENYIGSYVKIFAALRDENYAENNVISGVQFAVNVGGIMDTDVDDFTYEAIDSSTCRITRYTGSGRSINIPSKGPDGCTVTEIGRNAFKQNTVIQRTTVPSSVKTIGEDAFAFTGITEIFLPSGLKTIGNGAFRGCTELTEIDIPRMVTAIGTNAFADCSNLTINGIEDTIAQTYASANSIPFAAVLDDEVSSWNVGIEGAETTLRIRGDASWSIMSVPEWVSLSTSHGTNQIILTVSVGQNSGAAREGRLIIKEGVFTNSLYIAQEGTTTGLSTPIFSSPNENEMLSFDDVSFVWTAEGAASSVLSLRDLTTNQLIISHENMGSNTSYTLPASTFMAGHQYRVAVGASEEENPYSSDVKKWKELLFSVRNEEEHSTRLSGRVISSNNNPLKDVFVTVKTDGRIVAVTSTNSDGSWAVDSLYRGGEYSLEFSKSGYVFSDDKTIATSEELTIIDTLASDNAYDDEVVVLSANTDILEFGSERNSSELKIISDGSWTIRTDDDVDWLSFSTDHGTGNSWIVVTADANSEAEAGSEDRIATITIEEILPEHSSSLFNLRNAAPSGRSVTVNARQNSRVAQQTGPYPFEGNNYTGAAVVGSHTFPGNLTINKEMDLTSGNLTVTGDLTVKAPINFGKNGKLTVRGKLTVAGNGILNMKNGGLITVDGDFKFSPSTSHKNYLEAGEIKIGRNAEITKNYYAGSEHRFTVMDNGARHKINMWNKWDWVQEDQYFGTFNAETSITKLEIIESFTAAHDIWNFRDFTRYHSGHAFELVPLYGKKLSNDEKARIQSGIMRLIGEYGKKKSYLGINFLHCEAEDSFAYIGSDNQVHYFDLELNMTQYNSSSASLGTGVYQAGNGPRITFSITTPYADIDKVLKDFNQWKRNLLKGAVISDIKGVAIDAFSSDILEILPIGGSTKEFTKAMIKNSKDLADLYEALK